MQSTNRLYSLLVILLLLLLLMITVMMLMLMLDCVQVSCEERLYALSETGWDVNNAIKLLLLRQLMSGCSEDAERCKEALMSAGWDVRLATWNLGPRPQEPDSPEIIHV